MDPVTGVTVVFDIVTTAIPLRVSLAVTFPPVIFGIVSSFAIMDPPTYYSSRHIYSLITSTVTNIVKSQRHI
jgi:hypothetical protein